MCSSALENIKVTSVAITVATSLLLIGLGDRDSSEFYGDFAVLDSFCCRRLVFEIDDSEATITHLVTHLLHWHEAAFDWTEFLHDGFAEDLLVYHAWDFSQPDALRVGDLLLLLLLLLSCLLCLEGSSIESSLFGTCNVCFSLVTL